MLFELTEWLKAYVSGFNVFGYLTFRSVLGVLTALIFSFAFGPMLIRYLYRFKFGQPVRDDGPQSHLKKTGTPTMGGVLILAAVTVATLLWADLSNRYVWFALFVTLAFGAVGFADDYIKIKHKSPKGLPARKKYFWLSLAGFATAIGIFDAASDELVSTLDIADLLSVDGFDHPHDAVFLPNGDLVFCTWGTARIAYFRRLV